MFGSRRGLAAFVLAVFVAVFVLAQPHRLALGGDTIVRLPSGTTVFAVFDHSVTSGSVQEGDIVYLRVMRPVMVDKHTVIRTGEKVSAKVTESQEGAGWGKAGELEIRIDSTTAVDGQEIFLSYTQRREGKGKAGKATAWGVGLGLLCLPLALIGFTVKGEEGRFPTGYEMKVYVSGEYEINVAAAGQLSPVEERKRVRELQLEIEQTIQEEKTKEEEEEKKEEAEEPGIMQN